MASSHLRQEYSSRRNLPAAAPCEHEGLSNHGQHRSASSEDSLWLLVPLR